MRQENSLHKAYWLLVQILAGNNETVTFLKSDKEPAPKCQDTLQHCLRRDSLTSQ